MSPSSFVVVAARDSDDCDDADDGDDENGRLCPRHRLSVDSDCVDIDHGRSGYCSHRFSDCRIHQIRSSGFPLVDSRSPSRN